MPFISTLKLHNFRCYRGETLTGLPPGLIVLHGPNGAGKTNVLEALSLLSPGRGLRGARAPEMQCRDDGSAWAVAAEVETGHGSVLIGTGLDPKTEKRIVRVQGEKVKSQSALSEHMCCVWLTPQMDRLFLDSAGERRRFLDRLIFSSDPGHAGRIKRYENAMAQRSRLLKEGRQKEKRADHTWLLTLEAQMAETGVAISAARLDFCQRLQMACVAAETENFPLARLHVGGTLETLLMNAPAVEAEDLFKYQLQESREKDSSSGGAATGAHKSDMVVYYASKNMKADQCSTGEQKALLIGIVLAHAQMMKSEKGAVPVLLLDEIAAHLDENRRAVLYGILQDLRGQVWLTGTDENLFSSITNSTQFFHVHEAHVDLQRQGGGKILRAV
ncbi:MAG: DNA replication/repair protein RecF [Alphaproteobacteria bacterium]